MIMNKGYAYFSFVSGTLFGKSTSTIAVVSAGIIIKSCGNSLRVKNAP